MSQNRERKNFYLCKIIGNIEKLPYTKEEGGKYPSNFAKVEKKLFFSNVLLEVWLKAVKC
jgi:hypothetical protein